jgi:hypothetical protein
MIAVIMVAEVRQRARDAFEILDLLFGADYVVPCAYGELTRTSAGAVRARADARRSSNEAVVEDSGATAQRRLATTR